MPKKRIRVTLEDIKDESIRLVVHQGENGVWLSGHMHVFNDAQPSIHATLLIINDDGRVYLFPDNWKRFGLMLDDGSTMCGSV